MKNRKPRYRIIEGEVHFLSQADVQVLGAIFL
jgi:hypothetical protein